MAATPVSAAGNTRTLDITAAPRVMITFASGLVNRVLGDRPSARENAWQSVLADRERAATRAELADVLRGAVPSGARNSRARNGSARNSHRVAR
jgi:hypothetical protein